MFEKIVIKLNDDEIDNSSSFKSSSNRKQQQNNQQTRSNDKKNRNYVKELKIAISRFSIKLLLLHEKSEKQSDFQNILRKFSKNKEKNRKNL